MYAYANKAGWPLAVLLPLTVLLAALLGLLMPSNPRLENVLNTSFPAELDSRIRLVAIDEETLQHYGRTDTWSRDFYALALRTLQSADAAVIGVDVLFSQPSNADQALAQALLDNKTKVVLATSPDLVSSSSIQAWGVPTGVSALNPSTKGVREYQRAYQAANGELYPSLVSRMAELGGVQVPQNSTPQLLRYIPESALKPVTFSFRQVVDDNVPYRELQGKWILLGIDAKGMGSTFNDIDGGQVSGLTLQARALSSLLAPAFWRMPIWLTILLCIALALTVVWIRGLWGYALAFIPLLAAVALWQFNIIVPGVTISLAAIMGSSLLALERWWSLRRNESHDPLTGVYSRLAFTRAMEHRWPSHLERPLSLILVELRDLPDIYEQQGQVAGDDALRQLAQKLLKLKRRSDMVFRWGPGEFALLLDNTNPQELQELSHQYQLDLSEISYKRGVAHTIVGSASTGPDIQTPGDLMNAASQQRQRLKFARNEQA